MKQNEPQACDPKNKFWAYDGSSLGELEKCRPREVAVPQPGPDEVVAKVEAVSICSSDVKIVQLGADHPLFSQRDTLSDAILGHEVCLRVHAVGKNHDDTFTRGQRLGLQPAMRVDGTRRIFGMDLPGGFAQYLVLGREALADYVFAVPESLSAAEISLLEPYACVERAFHANCRQTFDQSGRALFVLGPDADQYATAIPLSWRELTIVDANEGEPRQIPAFLHDLLFQSEKLENLSTAFDDIIALGEIDAETLSKIPPLVAERGLFLQARQTAVAATAIDPARVHYHSLAFIGTKSHTFTDALSHDAQRFDVRPGGTALVHGAGGAMGRIHVHRLLQLKNGPSVVIASSRKGSRLEDLLTDFEPVARQSDRRLVVVSNDKLAETIAALAPNGVDDAVVVAPNVDAVAVAAGFLASDGLLSVFAGFPFGGEIDFDLSGIAVTGKRLTGSTGCTVADMQGVLARVLSGELDVLANVRAVAGLDALPEAFLEVNRGVVSGKIVIYPQSPEEPLRHLNGGWSKQDEAELINGAEPVS